MRAVSEKFVDLGQTKRVWAIAAINGDLDRLITLHDHLASRFASGDRLVYLGNYLGVGGLHNKDVIEEILAFRAALLSKPGMEPCDIVHLRGPAEEAWQRLLRLQFAPVPTQTLEKLQAAGVESYLRLYNVSLHDAKSIARAGSVAITRWTNQLRDYQRGSAGHEALMCSTRRAAFSRNTQKYSTLFVPAGYDETRSLEDQGEALWWGSYRAQPKQQIHMPFARIVRGFDANQGGVSTDSMAVTLDGRCGRGGPLVCGAFDSQGRISDIIAVGGQGALENLTNEDRFSQRDVMGERNSQPIATPSPYWGNQMAASA